MEMLKLTGITLVAVVLIALLRSYLPAYSTLAVIAVTVLMLSLYLMWVQPVLTWLKGLTGLVSGQEFECVVRAVGIVLVAQVAKGLCKDAELSALGEVVELGGRCLVMMAALPLFRQVLERLMELLT